MKLRVDDWYVADKGKRFVLTEKGKAECASYKYKTVGQPVDECDSEAARSKVEKGYVMEADIPGWTTLHGFEVVYYLNGIRIPVGNPHKFPIRTAAEKYKKHYESYPWMHHELFIEEIEYDGIPLGECSIFNGKEVIDKEHYFGLDACEIGDYFTEDMINDFMDVMPPACMRSDCSQIGEPISHRIDENGKSRSTYSTFKQIAEGIWEYCGDCFRGENVKRGTELQYV